MQQQEQQQTRRRKTIDTVVTDDPERMARYVIRAQKCSGEPNSAEVCGSRAKGISWHLAVGEHLVEVVRRQSATKTGAAHSRHYIYRTNGGAHDSAYDRLLASIRRNRDQLLSPQNRKEIQ